jgi:hypothetical protein
VTIWKADDGRGFAGGRSLIGWSGSCRISAARFVDDPHVWASALFDEVVPLGYDRS